jgi:hypothetical protein
MKSGYKEELVEGWQLTQALQRRLRRDGNPVQVRAESPAVKKKSSVASYSSDSNDVSAKS